MPHDCFAVFNSGIDAYMGPVLVILVLIPEHNVAGLCSDIIQILDPFLIIHTLDKFPVIERFNDLIYIIVIKPCN